MPLRRRILSCSMQRWEAILHRRNTAFLIEILDAITYHTTGRPDMTVMDKIIYIADYIEPGRSQAPGLPEVRRLDFTDLDDCLFRILGDTLDYLTASKMEIDEATRQTYDYYKSLREQNTER